MSSINFKDLNYATFVQLQAIRGIGPTRALSIKTLQPNITSFEQLATSSKLRLSTTIIAKLKKHFFIAKQPKQNKSNQSSPLANNNSSYSMFVVQPINIKSLLENMMIILFKRIKRTMRKCNSTHGVPLGRFNVDMVPNVFDMIRETLPSPTKKTATITTYMLLDIDMVFDKWFSSFVGAGYPFQIKQHSNITEINSEKYCVISYSLTTFKLKFEIPFVKWASEARDFFIWS